jgi:hypothetical protein
MHLEVNFDYILGLTLRELLAQLLLMVLQRMLLGIQAVQLVIQHILDMYWLLTVGVVNNDN